MAEAVGPELLTNGDFSQSAGIGASSTIGPGWTTDYNPCGPNIFNVPCGGNTYAFFTTNAGQVTGNHVNAVPIMAQGGRSMAVNVSANTNDAIIEWLNIPFINGQNYRFRMKAARINNPFSVAMRIDGGAQGSIPVPSPVAASTWEYTIVDFQFTGPSGNYSVGLFSNSGVLAGNDHAFDEFSLRTLDNVANLVDPLPCDCCPLVLEPCPYYSGDPVGEFETVTVLSNPLGFTIDPPLEATIDGDSSGGSFGRIINGDIHNTQVDIEYKLPFTARNVSQFSIWNNHGAFTNDNDGIDGDGDAGTGGTRFQLLDDNYNVLYNSSFFNAQNGAGPDVTNFALLAGVRYVRLLDIKSRAPIGAVDTGWRLVRLNGDWANRTAIPMICDGELRWFDIESGDEVDQSLIACNPTTVCTNAPDNTNMNVTGTGPFTWSAVAVAPATLSFYDYSDPVVQWEAQYSSAGPPASWFIRAPELGGDLRPSLFVPALAASQGPGYVGTATQNGVTVVLETLAGNLLPNFALNRWGSFGGAVAAHMRVTFYTPVTLSIVGGPDFGDGINEGFNNVQAATVPSCGCFPQLVNFNPVKSSQVEQRSPGLVTATVGTDANSVAVYDGPFSRIELSYLPPSVPGLVLSLSSAETGFIDLDAFTAPLAGSGCGSALPAGPYTGTFNGVTVTLEQRVSPAPTWGSAPFAPSNPAGSLCINAPTQAGVWVLNFSTPVHDFELRGWGAWSNNTDDILVRACFA